MWNIDDNLCLPTGKQGTLKSWLSSQPSLTAPAASPLPVHDAAPAEAQQSAGSTIRPAPSGLGKRAASHHGRPSKKGKQQAGGPVQRSLTAFLRPQGKALNGSSAGSPAQGPPADGAACHGQGSGSAGSLAETGAARGTAAVGCHSSQSTAKAQPWDLQPGHGVDGLASVGTQQQRASLASAAHPPQQGEPEGRLHERQASQQGSQSQAGCSGQWTEADAAEAHARAVAEEVAGAVDGSACGETASPRQQSCGWLTAQVRGGACCFRSC